jgi:hypothetical protein
MEEIHGAGSWKLANEKVTLYLTQEGGMVGPVEFDLGGKVVSPYALAPWRPDEVDAALPPLLKNLRGDFFCLPFGPQEGGDPHGASANREWTMSSASESELRLEIQDSANGAKLEKRVSLKPGHTAVYSEYRITGLEGDWSYGNHPILDASNYDEGSVRISVSPLRWGSVYQGIFSAPERNESQGLKPSAVFARLDSVPRLNDGFADLTRWPARLGCDDLVMLVNEEATDEQPFAWSAAVFDGFVWFSLKNSEDFPATLLWMSNGGRQDEPWQGRHWGRIGIEEVCSHFSDGVAVSRENRLASEGVPTTQKFRGNEERSLRIVQAASAVPQTFGMVTSIVPDGEGAVVISDENDDSVRVDVDWSHVL